MRLKNFYFYTAVCVLLASFSLPACSKVPNTKAEIDCLNGAYYTFHEASSDEVKTEAANKYLTCFPSTFSGFERLFGFDMKTGTAAPLYREYPKHLGFIGENYSFFNKRIFAEKFIDIAVSSHGEAFADAEELLQRISLTPIKNDPDIGLTILSEYSNVEIENYWRFVLDRMTHGFDRTLYSCPAKFSQSKACKVLSNLASVSTKEASPQP